MGDAPLLEVTDLAVHFPVHRGLLRRQVGTVKAVDGVSFTLPEARTFGLVGESGSGKSTTARAVLRLVDITAGTVRLAGRDVTQLQGRALRRIRRRMQMIFQDPYASLNPRMTLLDIIAEPLRTHGRVADRQAASDEVGKLMDRVGLPRAYLRRFPHELSGGQRQRVGIARAAALGPQLIVADEPVSALDMSIRAQILNLLADLQEDLGVAYLLIAHDLAVMRHVCDEIGVMYLGRIVERAPAARLFAAPTHPYTQALLAAIPIPDPVRERARRHVALAGEPPSAMAPPAGCAFHPRCPLAETRCERERPELEEAPPGHWVACHLAGIADRAEGTP